MIVVRKTGKAVEILNGRGGAVTSLDGTMRCPVALLTSPALSDAERLRFGVHLLDESPRGGKEWTGKVVLRRGKPSLEFAGRDAKLRGK